MPISLICSYHRVVCLDQFGSSRVLGGSLALERLSRLQPSFLPSFLPPGTMSAGRRTEFFQHEVTLAAVCWTFLIIASTVE